MSTFVLMYFFVLLYFFVRKWLRAVKIYLHAKFRASSSKIERVMLNFVFGAGTGTGTVPPVTNLPVELRASRQLTSTKVLKQLYETSRSWRRGLLMRLGASVIL